MTNTEKMAIRIEELMNEGRDLQTALATAQAEFQPKKSSTGSRTVISNRVEWIAALGSVSELRKAVKVAFAKKSKAKGKPETESKYQAEIDAGKARLNELIADINRSENHVARAIELGEDIGGVIQRYLDSIETKVEAGIKERTDGMTMKAVKELIQSQSNSTPATIFQDLSTLGDEYLTAYEGRASRGDQRVLTLNKRQNFLEAQVDEIPSQEDVVPTDEDIDTTTETPEEVEAPKRGRRNKKNNEQEEA